MLLYVIRHGDPIYNPDSLTELGHQQAKALADRLCVHGLDKIFSSPMLRARQTAEPTAERLGLPIILKEFMSEDILWREMSHRMANGNYGWSFMVQNTELCSDENLSLPHWYDAPQFSDLHAKEAYERVQRESDEFIASLGYVREGDHYRIVQPNDQKVGAFCHQGFGTTWLSHLLGLNPLQFWAGFNIAHSSITILEFRNNANGITKPQCLCLSDLSHVYASGLPLKYSNTLDI